MEPKEPKGYLSIVLHAHLPFVRHPEYDEFLEEDWFFEAMTETYIPLVHMFERLHDDGVPFQLTLSLSPTLLSMMNDSLLTGRYLRYLDRLIDLANREVERTQWLPEFHRLALMYHWRLTYARNTFVERYGRNLIHAFRRFAELGHLELMTCGATHGFFPLMSINEKAVRAQIEMAVRTHEYFFGDKPAGIWLPECGFDESVVKLLKHAGLKFFFVDTHGVLHASPRPRYGVYAPIICPDSKVACFGRDLESSKQVWSAEEGYPGDLCCQIRYILSSDNSLSIKYHAKCTEPTPVNLANHSYFNLSEQGNILQHSLKLYADKYLPADDELLPTGEILSVKGTSFDFSSKRVLKHAIKETENGFDNTFVINNGSGRLKLAAVLKSPDTGIVMEVLTTKPGIHLYTGNFLDNTVIGKNGKALSKFGGLCLEDQHFPDSPNIEHFPSTILLPGEVYMHETVYKFYREN